MLHKKLLSIFICIVMVFSFVACQKDNAPDNDNILTDENTTLVNEANGTTASSTDALQTATTTNPYTTEASEASSISETDTTAPTAPEEWTTAQIISAYKKIAAKSNATAKSEQVITLKSISVNNGKRQGVLDFITPIISKLLSNNSKVIDGITGGYNNLSPSDVASAKAYENGNTLVVEMLMNTQTAGINEDAKSGCVGHAITTVGDISVVTKQLKDLGIPLELNDKGTKIHYTNPTVKVVIDPKGNIVNGTWQFTAEIRMDNYKAFGKTINTTSVIVHNVITVNGGFKK